MRYLLRFKACYADEFMIEGLYMINEHEYRRFNSAVEEFTEADFYFGTNECVTFNGKDQLKEAYEIMELSREEYKVLIGLGLARTGFGAKFYDFVVDHEEEEC